MTGDLHPHHEPGMGQVWQVGYGCHHALRSPSNEELLAAGVSAYRIAGFLDVSGPCPACRDKRAAKRAARKAARA